VTPSTVSDVSATFVARITLRSLLGASAASCSSAGSDPWSGSTRAPAGEPSSADARRISGAPGRKQSTCPPGRASTPRTASASDVRGS
jgi:hypothetical protein